MTDPAEIDLEAIITRRHPSYNTNSIVLGDDFNALVAAVEALRGRLVETAGQCAEALGDLNRMETRAEDSEARCVELAGALEAMRVVRGPKPRKLEEALAWVQNDDLVWSMGTKALAAMPPEALERARAKDDMISAMRDCRENSVQGMTGMSNNASVIMPLTVWNAQGDALDNLDTLLGESKV